MSIYHCVGQRRTKHVALSKLLPLNSAACAHNHKWCMIGGAHQPSSVRVQLKVFQPLLPPQLVCSFNRFGGSADDVRVTVKRVSHNCNRRHVYNSQPRLDGVANEPIVISAQASVKTNCDLNDSRSGKHQTALTQNVQWRKGGRLRGKLSASKRSSQWPNECKVMSFHLDLYLCGGRWLKRENLRSAQRKCQ